MLSQYFEYVPVCPEYAIGLGVPREPIHLVGNPHNPRVVGVVDATLDVTNALTTFAQQKVQALNNICGYILMQKSPSCGMQHVKVHQHNSNTVQYTGSGVFAAALMRAKPNLPVEEEVRLNDPIICENFIMRVFAYADWQQLLSAGVSRHALYTFHTRYTYQLMANSPTDCSALEHLLANNPLLPLGNVATQYFSLFMSTLKKHPIVARIPMPCSISTPY